MAGPGPAPETFSERHASVRQSIMNITPLSEFIPCRLIREPWTCPCFFCFRDMWVEEQDLWDAAARQRNAHPILTDDPASRSWGIRTEMYVGSWKTFLALMQKLKYEDWRRDLTVPFVRTLIDKLDDNETESESEAANRQS